MAFNAVERRLLDLRSLWEDFTGDPDKRLLIWEAPGEALRLIECFFEAQKHDVPYSTRDLCIVLKTQFENSIQYSRTLKEALAETYAASQGELEQEGIPADWTFKPEQVPDSASGFVQALWSFGWHHQTHIGHLAAVLAPTEVLSEAAFAGWVSRALDACSPERLRIAVVDPGEAPRLQSLVEAGDRRIMRQVPELEILTVAQETFAQEAATGPAALFRNLLMALVTLVEKGSVDQVCAKAADAFDFAGQQGWHDQQVAIFIVVAGAQLKDGRFDEAVHTYRSAAEAAQQATEGGHPAGQKLLLQAMFGEAGAQLAAGRLLEAAQCYDVAAATALSAGELLLLIEALRMGAFCHMRLDDAEGALDRGRRALEMGGHLAAEYRGMTTLPSAAIDLLRTIDPERIGRVDEIGSIAEAEVEAALMETEQAAAALEHSMGSHANEDVLRALEARRAAAKLQAEARLQNLVAGAGADFREAFNTGRALLGSDWPVAAIAPSLAPLASVDQPEKELAP